MILYRDMKYQEYKKILHDEKISINIGYSNIKENTFSYSDTVPYMHFFKYLEHANMYAYLFGDFIVKCYVPDELIEESGFGFYQYKKFRVDAPIPEFIIKRSEFLPEYIEEINPSKRRNVSKILGVDEVKLYHMFLIDMYQQWKKDNVYVEDEFAFCKYVMAYLSNKDLDDILLSYCADYLEKTGKIRMKKR